MMSAPDPAVPPTEIVRGAVERILASSNFRASERHRRFLRYIVDETLAGRADRIKGYSVGVAVFDREESFDSQLDPIVRIGASQLRRSLDYYYVAGGKDDEIRITIPRGSYVPVFTTKDTTSQPADTPPASSPGQALDGAVQITAPAGSTPEVHYPSRRPGPIHLWLGVFGAALLAAILVPGFLWRMGALPSLTAQTETARQHGPAVVVTLLQEGDAEAMRLHLGPGLTREIIAALTHYRELQVFGTDTSLTATGENHAEALAQRLSAEYVLSGTVSTTPDRIRLLVSLIDGRTGRHLWSHPFESPFVPARIVDTRAEIAQRVVDTLARPYGVIYEDKIAGLTTRAPERFSSYECLLLFYAYWRRTGSSIGPSTRDCLERAIVEDPDYADAWAALALVYADIVRFGVQTDPLPFDPLERALELAQRAVTLSPDTPLGYQALHLVFWLRRDVEQSFAAARAGLAQAPNNPELLADLGGRLCLRGQFAEGLPLLTESFSRNPGQSTFYRLGFFVAYYMDRQYQAALNEALKIDLPDNRFTQIARATAYAELGRNDEATAAIKLLLKIDPGYGEYVVADLQARNVAPEIIRALVEGLRKAGLAIPKAGT
ncbi:tetratricopeptide repeat protein [Inquilinus sp. OTU3971]|uniref:tetratricopeptide repeat protein n=1 Tax=Inquilinus sp. OTU3971 TaxID=3043855 RepID=UPI00313EF492